MPHSKFNPWNKVYLVKYLNCWGDNPGYVIADDGRMVEVMAVEWNASEDSWFYILANEDRSEIYSAYERSDVVCRDYPEARDRAAELNRMIRERDAGGIRCECCHRWHWMSAMTLPEDYAAYRKSAGWTERDGKWSCPDCITPISQPSLSEDFLSLYGDNRWRWSAGHADGFDDNGYEGSLSEAAMAIAKIVTGEAGLEVYTSEELAARIVASWLPEAWLVYWTFNGYSTYISKYQDLAGQWPKYAYSVHSMLESFYWHISFDGLDYDWYIIGPNKLEERGKEPTMQAAALALANIIIEHADDEEDEEE